MIPLPARILYAAAVLGYVGALAGVIWEYGPAWGLIIGGISLIVLAVFSETIDVNAQAQAKAGNGR